MNTVSIQDEEFKKSKEYQEFITLNSGKGNLKYLTNSPIFIARKDIITALEFCGCLKF